MNQTVANATMLAGSLRELLANEFHAQLAGSWATFEAHIPAAVGDMITSFSDVDVLADGPMPLARVEEIKRTVMTLARDHRVEVTRVSVRPRSEIDAFWKPRQARANSCGQFDNGRFMLFWSLIGAVEACSGNAHRSERALAYATVKFFFKLSRNLLLIRGGASGSYRDVARQISMFSVHPSDVCRAYAIKVGKSHSLPVSTSEALLGDAAWQPMLDGVIDVESMEMLAGLREDIRKWHRTGAAPDASAYVALLQLFDEEPNLTPARIRVVQTHGFHNCN